MAVTVFDDSFKAVAMREYRYEFYDASLDVPAAAPASTAFSVFPNPTSGAFRLQCDGPLPAAPLRMMVYNASGQLVSARELQPSGRITGIGLDAGISPGLYLIRIWDGNGAPVYQAAIMKR